MELRRLTVETPDGRRPLVRDLDLAVGAGGLGASSRLLVVGPSGAGKSSILRAIAGLWTRGSGTVARPPAGDAMFLPQRPYMPLGNLRTQLLYPGVAGLPGDGRGAGVVSDEDLVAVLAGLGLAFICYTECLYIYIYIYICMYVCIYIYI